MAQDIRGPSVTLSVEDEGTGPVVDLLTVGAVVGGFSSAKSLISRGRTG